jgi:hypothetical protein
MHREERMSLAASWARLIARVVVVVAALAAYGAEGGIEVITSDVLPPEQRHGVLDVSSGAVKYAAWGCLRMEIKRVHDVEKGDAVTIVVFALGERPELPQQGKDPKCPVLMPEKTALDERKNWRQLSLDNCHAVYLGQDTGPTTRLVVVVGVAFQPDKRGGIDLFWRYGAPPKESFPLYEVWSCREALTIVAGWGAGLKPRVIPFLSSKKEETALVLRKGKRTVAVVRFQPAVQGGNPYPRIIISSDVDAQHADGAVVLAEERTSKTLIKFAADHPSKDWDRATVSFLVTVSGRSFFVLMRDDAALGLVYDVYEKPAP